MCLVRVSKLFVFTLCAHLGEAKPDQKAENVGACVYTLERSWWTEQKRRLRISLSIVTSRNSIDYKEFRAGLM